MPPGSPSTTAQAALDGNLFFLQLYTEVGGFLDAAPHLQHDAGGCFDALSVRRFFFLMVYYNIIYVSSFRNYALQTGEKYNIR